MKRKLSSMALALVLFLSMAVQAKAAEYLIPVGKVIGLELRNDTITVVAYDDVFGSAARDAGLKIGDQLLQVNDTPITRAQDVRSALGSGEASLTIRRDGKLSTLRIQPGQAEDGPRLGVYLRQGIAGIGTVTFYDPNTGLFGTLGHGVCDAKGNLLQMTQGQAYAAQVAAAKKGKAGDPGQLKGSAQASQAIGILTRNTPQGVFGINQTGWQGSPIPTADYAQISEGPACIRTTVTGEIPREYSVELLKIYPQSRQDGRNFLLRITDPALLETTGGIVCGMSGSPIIQNGRLVGAVTHVLVNDPTMGYGIYIGNMLDAAA